MCGIAGFLDVTCQDPYRILKQMTDALTHRGPDDQGHWVEQIDGIALGHRRLSILDLSPAGIQPMHSESGRFVIVFNGEIYNHEALRKDLSPVRSEPWRGHSDTEVMLASIERWGIKHAVTLWVGMFAFALWDRREKVLWLGRDRIGEKPLYYGYCGDTFVFGSELKAFTVRPGWDGRIDRDALAQYFRFNYIPAPRTIFRGIRKLLPGTLARITPGKNREFPDTSPYWSVSEIAREGVVSPSTGSAVEMASQLKELLLRSVGGQMVADVPLGAFLSGGVDSSTVVALMQAQSSRPVRTFTIGFSEGHYNEADHARAVARHLGTDHTELLVTPADAMEAIPSLPFIYDEPFADASQIPTLLVAKLARRHVTVSLSGDGGDELFGGYNRYFWGNSIWKKVGPFPAFMRRTAASLLTSCSPAAWDHCFEAVGSLIPPLRQQRQPGDKLHKLARLLDVESPEAMYRAMITHWPQPESIVLGATEPDSALDRNHADETGSDYVSAMMLNDMLTYLPDDILVKVDRAAMGLSLETRVPLLDHRVIEFAWKTPREFKIRHGQGKWLLRQVLYKYVPKELIERPKMGFGVPIDSWLRGPLRPWAEALLNENRMRSEGYLNPLPIRVKWQEHLSGVRNWQYLLWAVLMFQSWLEANRET